MGACFLTWSSPHQGFAIIPLLASWMLLIRWCVSHMLSKRVVSHMLSKRVVSHKRTGNTSGACRVNYDRGRDEHHPIGQRLMAEGKLALLSNVG